MRRVSYLVAALATAATLTACGSSPRGPLSPNGPSPHTGAPATTTNAALKDAVKAGCDVVPPAMVKEQTGVEVKSDRGVPVNNAILCTYSAVSGDGNVTVRIQSTATATTFKTTRETIDHGGTATANLAGLGDEAYTASRTDGARTTSYAGARKGSLAIFASSDRATVAQLQALLQAAFAKR